ncbi:MAG: sugar ABC transporter permease [Clostridiales bacterium]|nr:sugar ABC transporter permease [Clostridiales bacterium]
MYIKNNAQKKITVFLFLLPSVAGLIVFNVVPIISALGLSFFRYDILKPIEDMTYIGLSHYRTLLSSGELRAVLTNTLYYMVMYIPIIIVVSLLLASMLSRKFKGVTVYKVLFYLPVLTSWVAGALIWKWILNGEYGLLNQFLAFFGIQGPSWLTNRVWAMPGIVLASIWKDSGHFALIFLAALIGVNKSYYEAAEIDGAGTWKKFSRITLPLISPIIFLVIIINIIAGFQIFESIFIMTGGGPGNATIVIVERIYKNAFKFYRMGYAAAYSWVLFIIIFVVTYIQFKFKKRWVNYDS